MSLAIDTKGNWNDNSYSLHIENLGQRFRLAISDGKEPLFTTNATGLWEAYLDTFPENERQYHNCNCCRSFIERYGGLVVIDEDGLTKSPIWAAEDDPDDIQKVAEGRLLTLVAKAKVTGVFLSSETEWGTRENVSQKTGDVWRHFCVVPPPSMVHRSRVQTAGQAMAEKREDKKNVSRALSEFNPELVELAVQLLNSDTLYRSEKVGGPALFLQSLHTKRAAAKNRDNITWREIARAPTGFCHPRSSMVGTLLEDLASGKSFEATAASFKAKMHPLSYQRPQAAPSAGAIEAAEKLVEKLGIQRSLERRFARLEEVTAFWRPAENQAKDTSGSAFGHLKESAPSSMNVQGGKITFSKLRDTILPTATKMELLTPSHGNFGAIVTALHDDAPPILQWDSEEERNPFSWYLWHGGSSAMSWGLGSGRYVEVKAICEYPAHWKRKHSHHQESAILLLDGARETKQSGNALFPETLKSELHGARSVIEAYAKMATIHGMSEGSACGLIVQSQVGATVRVTNGKLVTQYQIDRWD